MVPRFQEITLPLLRLAADGHVHTLAQIRPQLAKVFGLTDAEQTEQLPSGRQTRFANRVAWAKVYLEKARILDSPGRGQFRITERGRQVLMEPPQQIDIE